MKELDYKDFIKSGNKCIYDFRVASSYGPFDMRNEIIITIGEYKPYYTDGTPDPTPDEYDSDCWVECSYEQIVGTPGSARTMTYCDQFQFAGIRPLRHIEECDKNDIERLFREIRFGSLYISDYKNSLDVDPHELCGVAEVYTDTLYEKYGDEWDNHLSVEGFIEYCYDYAAC